MSITSTTATMTGFVVPAIVGALTFENVSFDTKRITDFYICLQLFLYIFKAWIGSLAYTVLYRKCHFTDRIPCFYHFWLCICARMEQRQPTRAFRTSESESADFCEVRVRKFRTLKTLRTRTQRVCLFTHLYCKEVNISQKNSEISIFFFLKILLFPL
jgi:hypothetical protein